MGNTVSLIRHAFTEFLDNLHAFQSIKQRIELSPGLPVDNPTRSFWMFPPSPISRHCSEPPSYADVVIIGSGITGTSVAKTILDRAHSEGKTPVVLMLEARDACSGATGRNGGHISPPLYHDYESLKRDHGDVIAQKVIKFRLAHLQEIRRVADEEGILEQSQWREVEAVDTFYDEELFAKARAKVERYQRDLPFEASHHRVYKSAEAIEKYKLASDTVGCIASGAGAMHPYNFVTGVLSKLMERFPDSFFLCTNTACTSISASEGLYTVVASSKGRVKTPHVIHATNGWTSHLLEPMRGKIIPFLANMTSQRPGQSVPPETLQRSFVFYERPVGFDYLTRLPNGEREFMFGGGFAQEGQEGYRAIANVDDSRYSRGVGAHLGGALPRYFGEDNWGLEGRPPEGEEEEHALWHKGRVKATWSGVLGISADLLPWVGRLSASTSGRSAPSTNSGSAQGSAGKEVDFTPSGEWIAAGYSGEGMVHAWMCGKALAEMVMGREREAKLEEWFPEIMRVSQERWKKAKPENLLDALEDS